MRISCKEFYLDDVMAITAVPIEDYTGWQEKVFMPTIAGSGFTLPLTHAIVIGLHPATSGGDLIPIMLRTGKAEDTENDDVAGRKHVVTVKCEIDDRDSGVWPLLRTLELTCRHLLLTFRGGQQAFVAATQDTYLFEVNRDGSKTSVSFRIESLPGLQMII